MKTLSAILFSAFAAVLFSPANAEERVEAGPWGSFWILSPDWTCPEEQKYLNADFFRAVAYDLRDKVQEALNCGADINVRNSVRQVALHWAMYLDDPWMADFLISRGADQTARDGIGLTPAKSAELRRIRIRRKTARTCAEGEEVNPFNLHECRPAFSCSGGRVEIANGVCQCPPQTPFDHNGVCESTVACGGGTITGDNTCECPAEAPHYVNGKCLDKPYCPRYESFLPATECSECPAGRQRFVDGNAWFACRIPKKCQAPEYALNQYNNCVPTNICPEVGEPRYSQCRTDVALRNFDDSKCPEGAENEACRAAVQKARLDREFLASPASRIKGIERAMSLTLSGAGVTIGVSEGAISPYWKDDCDVGWLLSPIYIPPNFVVPLDRPNEDVPARYANYEDGECDRGLVRTHSDLPTIQATHGTSATDSSLVSYDTHVVHVVGILGIMAAQKDGYGVVGVAPEADYAYAYPTYSWDNRPDVAIVNYSIEERGGAITSYAAVDEEGKMLTTATRENFVSRPVDSWAKEFFQRRLDHVAAHFPADRRINVIAAGNHSYDELETLSGAPLYFPELRGNNLAVVAVDGRGRIASYSNRCGSAGASFCLSAPVEGFILLPDIVKEKFSLANGTSAAAPQVVGALALVKEYFNRMGGIGSDELVRRILETADKSGIYANERIYGAGLLDLGNALTPQGELQLFSGENVEDSESHLLSQSGLRTGPAFGDSIDKALEDSKIAAFDNLNAPFPVAAAGLVQSEWENDSLRNALLALQSEKPSPPQTQWDSPTASAGGPCAAGTAPDNRK